MPAKNEDLHGSVPDKAEVALLLIDVINDLEFEDGEKLLKFALPMAEKIAELKKQPTLTASVNSQWASVDKAAMQQAAWAPYINQQGIDTFNSDIDLGCYVFNVLYQFDFSTICKK